MMEINFGPEDVGKWAFDVVLRKWEKIIDFVKDSNYPVKTETKFFALNGLFYEHDGSPTLLPADHPAVLSGKLEIPIPPPPRKRVVLEPGWYYRNPIGDIFRTTSKLSPPGNHVFEITEPIILVDGEE